MPIYNNMRQRGNWSNKCRSSKPAQGFTLVELMVAMVLGLILIAGVLQVFVGNRQTQLVESSVGRVQEAGRLALDFISEDLRQAGYYGSGDLKRSKVPMTKPPATDLCTGRTEAVDVLNVSNGFNQYDKFVDDAIRVYSKSETGTWSPAAPASDIPATVVSDARNGSDLIVMWYATDTGARIPNGSVFSGTDNVSVEYSAGDSCFKPNDLAMLSHPAGSVLFKVTNSTTTCTGTVVLQHSTAGNCSASLGSIKYDRFSRAMKLEYRIYYVADTGRDNAQGNPVYALYRYANSAPAVELVEGVEFLKLSYGERILDSLGVDTGNVRYLLPAAADPKAIKAARIGVLVQGFESVRPDEDTNSYQLLPGIAINHDGSGIDHDGGKALRRVFSANVELRNRAQ